MPASNFSSAPLFPLFDFGKDLATLLDDAKKSSKQVANGSSSSANNNNSTCEEISNKTLYEEVEEKVNLLLGEMKYDSRASQDLFVEESMSNVIAKIERTLREFIHLDNDDDPANAAAKYEQLVERVETRFKALHQQQPHLTTAAESSSQSSSSSCTSAFLTQQQQQQQQEELSDDDDDDDSDPSFENLGSDIWKNCLLWFCFFPDGAEIKRRELIHWWVGMGLIEPDSDDEIILDLLVEQGFIERAIRNKKLFHIYRRRAHKATHEEGSLPILLLLRRNDDHSSSSSVALVDQAEKIEAVINIAERNLNVKTLNLVSEAKNAKVVHLGKWRHHDTDYIVVEDIDHLVKALKHMSQLRVLSLQGVSGIVELPDLVCKLENLRVLDLRACNNLESLPKGIGSLQQLTHLDLSECFLLDGIPKGVSSLINLRVLKGFVINLDTESGGSTTNNGDLAKLLGPALCSFSDLSSLTKLRKLTVRTRRMSFPTTQDFETLCKMGQLNTLKIAWVGSSDDAPPDDDNEGESPVKFPADLKKLELQAVPKKTASQLLWLISLVRGPSALEKLSIRGGELDDLGSSGEDDCFHSVRVLCLRHLPNLRMEWCRFRLAFPKLTRLEIFRCPNLIFFPCDENGVWEQSEEKSH